MCGITGLLSTDSGGIMSANRAIKHRGPDDEGVMKDGGLSMGHQRLSILDLSANGHQPMETIDKSLVIVFNGEIYNHQAIRKSLKFNDFLSSSDTETILYAYKEYGSNIFKEFNGIFSFAIYDREKKELILCRDHFGVKPLYYYFKDNVLLFGSEIKSFLKIQDWDRSINHKALVNYLHFLWSPGAETPFLHIKKLDSGHFVKVNVDCPAISLTKYYDIPFDGRRLEHSEEEWIKKVDDTFSTAVSRQLLSDVPVGFFLSGGLDSSIIAAKARELTGERLQCYTIATEFNKHDKEGFTNDLHYAKRVAKYLDVNLEVVQAQVDIVDDFDKMIWHLDEPQSDAAPLNVLNICSAARENGNVVLLGGAGGDDLFSGYRRHQALNFEKYFQAVPVPLLRLSKHLINYCPSSVPFFRRGQKLLKDCCEAPLNRAAGYYEWLALSKNKSLFSKQHQSVIQDYNPNRILLDSLENIPDEKDLLNQLLYWDMKFFLTDHNLNYNDKMSMAVGVESRVPFLDKELVELSANIPSSLKLKGRTTKYILKRVAEKYLPKDVIYRPKTGFGAPIRKWVTQDLNDIIQEYLSPKNIRERGIFDDVAVWKLIDDNKNGRIDASYTVWSLLAIESWFRQFVD